MVNCAIYSCLTMKKHFEIALTDSTEMKENNDLFSRRENTKMSRAISVTGNSKKKNKKT